MELMIDSNPISDFSPLLDLPRLEKLVVNQPIEKLACLQKHPSLKFIRRGSAYRPVAEFWRDLPTQNGGK